MFKNLIKNVKKHWIVYSASLILVLLVGSGVYYFINGGQQGLDNKQSRKMDNQRQWKANNVVNKDQNYENKIAPVTVVREAVQEKYGKNFDYAKNFKKIDAFITQKFNKNTAEVIANNTELVTGMNQKTKDSAIANIKGLTTKKYQGFVSKQVNVDFQSGEYDADDTTLNIVGGKVFAQKQTSFVKVDGALVGCPVISIAEDNEMDKQYPFYQMTVLYSPDTQGDITLNQLLKNANNLNISVDNKKVKPVFTSLIDNENEYSDSEDLEKLRKSLMNYNGYTILAKFNANNSNNAKPDILTMTNAKNNLNKKLIGQSFYVLTYEVPKSAVNNVINGGSVEVQIENRQLSLYKVDKTTNELNLGNYSLE